MKKYALLCTTLMSMSFVSVAHADTQQDKINNLSHLAPDEKKIHSRGCKSRQ